MAVGFARYLFVRELAPRWTPRRPRPPPRSRFLTYLRDAVQIFLLGDDPDNVEVVTDDPELVPDELRNAVRAVLLTRGMATELNRLVPAGPLADYARQLGLVQPRIDLAVRAAEIEDPYGGETGSVCRSCRAFLPDLAGRAPTGGRVALTRERCPECGARLDGEESRARRPPVRAAFWVALVADRFDRSWPSLQLGCPELVAAVEATMGDVVEERFAPW